MTNPAIEAGSVYQNGQVKFRTLPFVENGKYQKLLWLGVNGWIVKNESDREIMLIDPFPSYDKNGKSGRRRLVSLVNYLRIKCGRGYTFTGILLSHGHFDHADDIPTIYSLLTKQPGKLKYPRRRRRCRLNGGKCWKISELPPVYCDRDAVKRLKDKFNRVDAALARAGLCREIKYDDGVAAGGKSMYYGKSEIEGGHPQLKAGVQLKSFDMGHFEVTPYVWDHYSIFNSDRMKKIPGNRQKQTSFVFYRKGGGGDAPPKRTFISGSAGEMSAAHTIGLQQLAPLLTVDVLIQAICRDNMELVSYQKNNVNVNDGIICTHFDKFIGIPRQKGELTEDFEKVVDYVNRLDVEDLKKKVVVLDRWGFEQFLHG